MREWKRWTLTHTNIAFGDDNDQTGWWFAFDNNTGKQVAAYDLSKFADAGFRKQHGLPQYIGKAATGETLTWWDRRFKAQEQAKSESQSEQAYAMGFAKGKKGMVVVDVCRGLTGIAHKACLAGHRDGSNEFMQSLAKGA